MGGCCLSCSLSLDPVILWMVGNYIQAPEGGRGGATRLSIDTISRKSGVREDIDPLSCQPETKSSKHKRQAVHNSVKPWSPRSSSGH